MISAEHSHQTWGKKWNLAVICIPLFFISSPALKLKGLATPHICLFSLGQMGDGHYPSVRVQVTWLRSQRDLQEGDHLRRAWISAQLVYGGSSSAAHYLEISSLERIIHGVIQMWLCVLNSWYWEDGQSVQLLCALNRRHSSDPSSQLKLMHNEKPSGAECKH